MRSRVVSELRREQFARFAAMTPAQRLIAAAELRERGLRMFMTANRVDRETAIRAIRATRRIGRRPSGCLGPAHDD